MKPVSLPHPTPGWADPASPLPLVVVALPLHYGYFRNVARGVARYAGRKWRLAVSPGVSPAILDYLVAGGMRGVILSVSNDTLVPALRKLGVPAVNVSGRVDRPGATTVRPDDEAIGRLAARHLLEMGHTRLACSGGRLAFAVRRSRGFREAAREAGAEVVECAGEGLAKNVGAVRRLPRPLGVFLPTDQAACEPQNFITRFRRDEGLPPGTFRKQRRMG